MSGFLAVIALFLLEEEVYSEEEKPSFLRENPPLFDERLITVVTPMHNVVLLVLVVLLGGYVRGEATYPGSREGIYTRVYTPTIPGSLPMHHGEPPYAPRRASLCTTETQQ